MNATLFELPVQDPVDTAASDEYNTPYPVIYATRAVLGTIDLDPASNAKAQTVVQATTFYTQADNGLALPWRGTVWLNPPYSYAQPFVDKLLAEYDCGNVSAALLLLNNATDTQYGQSLLKRFPVCFVGYGGSQGSRISFWQHDPDEPKKGNRYAQMIFYLGPYPMIFAAVFGEFGVVLPAMS
jgi:hypothetical protein